MYGSDVAKLGQKCRTGKIQDAKDVTVTMSRGWKNIEDRHTNAPWGNN